MLNYIRVSSYDTRDLLFVVGIFLFSVFDMVHRYILYLMGFFDRLPDVVEVYSPMAHGVLAGGDLYIVHWDNRPPMFQFLNIGAAATGEYTLAFYLAIGVANAVTAVLIWKLTSRHYVRSVAIVAGILYMFALPVVEGRMIDARLFSNVFILCGFLLSSPAYSGISIAIAGLFHQYAVFSIPIVVFYHNNNGIKNSVSWVIKFCVAGLATVGISYGIVGAIWGIDSLSHAIRYTFFGSARYVGVHSDRILSIVGDPLVWFGNEWQVWRNHSLYYLFSGVAVWSWYKKDSFNRTVPVFATGLVLLSLPRLLRNIPRYNILPLPFETILAAVGIMYFYQLYHDDQS